MMDAFCEWPNPTLAAAYALPAEPTIPEWKGEKKWLSHQLSKVNGRYVPGKAKDAFAKMRGIRRRLRLFLPVALTHTFDGVTQKEVSLKTLAEELDCTPRTIQNYIWEAEKIFPGRFQVIRKRGCSHRFRFAVQLLVQIGAVVSTKPKGESKPAPAPPPPSKIREFARGVEERSARFYRALNSGKTREEALKEAGMQADRPKSEPLAIKEQISILAGMKAMLSPRAG